MSDHSQPPQTERDGDVGLRDLRGTASISQSHLVPVIKKSTPSEVNHSSCYQGDAETSLRPPESTGRTSLDPGRFACRLGVADAVLCMHG